MDLDTLFAERAPAREGRFNREHPVTRALAAHVRRRLPTLSADGRRWLADALADERRKWFALFVVEAFGAVPKTLYAAMVRAAVYEANPSNNRWFVEPCVRSYGHRAVVASLLGYLEGGSNVEKAGAANALYWTNAGPGALLALERGHRRTSPDEADRRSAALARELSDLRERQCHLLLREFVENADADVRRSILPGLDLAAANYPPELRPLVRRAIAIARGHPDAYVRHRVEVRLRDGRDLRPLPGPGDGA
jgi:hypothetical protein